MHLHIQLLFEFRHYGFDRLRMLGKGSFDGLQMQRILSAEFRFAATSGASLQPVNAFSLEARQPVIDDDLATTQNLGDFERGSIFAFPENDLATLAKGMSFAIAITVFQS